MTGRYELLYASWLVTMICLGAMFVANRRLFRVNRRLLQTIGELSRALERYRELNRIRLEMDLQEIRRRQKASDAAPNN